ncbi:MAG: helix-turn-helix domain-containing protein [Lachnospira eligens]
MQEVKKWNSGKQIKSFVRKHNYLKEELAERIYVSRQTISNWEK